MTDNVKCPKCGSKNVGKTGFSHGVGSGPVLSASISKQYQCSDCKEIFNNPKLFEN